MLHQRLIEALGTDAVKAAPEDLAVYAFDAYTDAGLPSAVVLPRSTREVCAIVKIARDLREPIVARGAGTGLCGGAVPVAGGIVLSFARMNRVLELDERNRRVRVQAGSINLDVSRHVESSGLFYAPDPSSQRISTIGGNIPKNAGGPHCLSYGTTVNHVLGLEVVDAGGEVFVTSVDDVGYDLTAALVGSEGTLGIVTSAWLRLLALPESVRVSVVAFNDVDSASEAVSAIIGAGILPTALEMMDAVITKAVEEAFSAGYPTDAAAVFTLLHGRGSTVNARVTGTLELESGMNDPMAVFLTLTCVHLLQNPDLSPGWFALEELAVSAVGGFALGLIGGFALRWLVERINLTVSLYPILIAAGALVIFGLANVLGASGFLAVYLVGLAVGSTPSRYRRQLVAFHEGVAFVAQVVLFVVLGLLVFPHDLPGVALSGVAIAAGLVLGLHTLRRRRAA